MDYQFENLGPDRFQEFCQALLVKTLPNLMCFPVGQGDGGRDAVVSLGTASDQRFAVYQVKFVRNDDKVTNPHKWLRDVIRGESPKVARLIPKGASAFYLLTNVRGTAATDVGSIDAVDRILKDAFKIPAQCWWRDDLSRRLEGAAELKWSFPELFTGLDLLRVLIEQGLHIDQQRRATAIRMFVRTQYDREREVRFKQVELQNQLIDLFVDVPVTAPQPLEAPNGKFYWQRLLNHHRLEDATESIGGATFFLSPWTQPYFNQVVLEGAPGQGKSTITQYVCQVHRMRLLAEQELSKVPDEHKHGPLRLPIRADLRDFATWLSKQDPFAVESGALAPLDWHKSLEAFLAALIRHHAGGVSFSVMDLDDTVKIGAVLIVLDGLDEIADIHKRQAVITEVEVATARLRDIAAALQIVVTSRPAAFANSPGFATAAFPHVQLTALTRPLINQYADRWLTARRLTGREASETKDILEVKLRQPHLLALARNPMQLAILLSLIHTRGASLPDKRTALYDSYVDLFFGREAEKSPVVRDFRDLLVEIHRYLGWVLHTAAEKGSHSGSISNLRLKALLRDYLRDESRDPALADTLFAGMIERVVFLISRVEGTVEFEVQPLREYFAGRYLYETAHYSPPGKEQKGTITDRFDGLSRNFYWLNVTRFFAGCFNKGELPALVDRLQELEKDSLYRLAGHTRKLCAMLLGDWVFNQHQRSTRDIARLITIAITEGHSVASDVRFGQNVDDAYILPESCGRTELVRTCTSVLDAFPPRDRAQELLGILQRNATKTEIDEWWRPRLATLDGEHLTQWLSYGSECGSLARCTSSELRKANARALASSENLNWLVLAGQSGYIQDSQSLTRSWLQGWRTGPPLFFIGRPRATSLLSQFILATQPFGYAMAIGSPAPEPLSKTIRERWMNAVLTVDEHSYTTDDLSRCKDVARLAHQLWERQTGEWATQLEPWSILVEKLRSTFGECSCAMLLAILGSSVRDRERWVRGPDLLDSSSPLCRRTRYARMKSGSAPWWAAQIAAATTQDDKVLTALSILRWANSTPLDVLQNEISSLLDSLDDKHWDFLNSVMWVTSWRSSPTHVRGFKSTAGDSSPRLIVCLAHRMGEQRASAAYLRSLQNYDGTDRHVWEFCVNQAFSAAVKKKRDWLDVIELARKAYAVGSTFWPIMRPSGRIPIVAARRVMESPLEFARVLASLASESCRMEAARHIEPLVDYADQHDWFGDQSGRDQQL
jgi:hypothetical protein